MATGTDCDGASDATTDGDATGDGEVAADGEAAADAQATSTSATHADIIRVAAVRMWCCGSWLQPLQEEASRSIWQVAIEQQRSAVRREPGLADSARAELRT